MRNARALLVVEVRSDVERSNGFPHSAHSIGDVGGHNFKKFLLVRFRLVEGATSKSNNRERDPRFRGIALHTGPITFPMRFMGGEHW